MCFPSVYHFYQIWVPTAEKTQMVSASICGIYVGEIVGFAVSGGLLALDIPLSARTVLEGWSLPFYFFGLVGVLWYPLWLYFGYETPTSHPYMDREEQALFEDGTYVANAHCFYPHS